MIRRNVIANFLGRGSSVAANYVFVPFYVAILGSEAFGIIAFYAILQTFSALADVGLSSAFSREAARSKNKNELFKLLAAIEFNLISAVVCISAVLLVCADAIATHWLPTGKTIGHQTEVLSLQLMAIMLTPQLVFGLYSSGLMGLERQVHANVLQAGIVLIRSGLVLVPIMWSPELTIFFGWQLVTTIVFAIAARLLLTNSLGLRGFPVARPDYALLKPHLTFAGGMFTISLMASLNMQIDKIVVSKLFSIEMFGFYALAATLAQLPVALTGPIGAAMLPRITALNASGRGKEATALFDKCTYAIATLSSAGAIAIMVFPETIFHVWLMDKNLPTIATDIARNLALGGLFQALGTAPSLLAFSQGHNRTTIIILASAIVLSIPLLAFSISMFGMIGATVSFIFINALYTIVLTQKILIRFYSSSILRWNIRCVIFPVTCNGAFFILGKLVSVHASLDNFYTVLIAVIFGCMSIVLISLVGKMRFGFLLHF